MKRLWQNDVITLLLRLGLLYGVLFLCRVVFYGMNRDTLGAFEWHEFPALFQGSLVFDSVSILYVNGLFVLLSLVPFRFRERGGYQRMLFWLYMGVNSLVVLLNLADAVYFHYAKKRFTSDEFFFTENENTGSILVRALAENWYLILVAAALIGLLVWGYRRIRYTSLQCRHWVAYYGWSSVALVGIAVVSVGLIRGGLGHSVRPITLNNAAQYTTSPQKASLILSNPFCVIRTLGSKQVQYVAYFDPQTLDSLFTPNHFPGMDTLGPNLGRRNIVIFTLESFSREHSGRLNPDLYPQEEGYTPFLDSLMEHGYVFADAYASGRKSIDALPSVLASLPSLEKPFVLLPQSLGEMRPLPRLLQEEGYETAFFCGSPRNSMGFVAFAQLAGVQRFFAREDYEKRHGSGDFDGFWGIWDEPFLQYMSEELCALREPFFANVFTLSSHHPFVVPEKYQDKLPPGKTKIQRPVAYTDQALRRFFDEARKQPWFANTIFVFTADHVSSEVYAEKTKTPTGNSSILLFLYTPDGALRGTDTQVMQQLDLMPTLLGLVGYRQPYFAFGKDLFREPERLRMATNYTAQSYQLITDSLVLFYDNATDRVTAVFERRDTLQQHNIVDPNSANQCLLERKLKAFLQQYGKHVKAMRYVVE